VEEAFLGIDDERPCDFVLEVDVDVGISSRETNIQVHGTFRNGHNIFRLIQVRSVATNLNTTTMNGLAVVATIFPTRTLKANLSSVEHALDYLIGPSAFKHLLDVGFGGTLPLCTTQILHGE
jgi:hypothetical protein